MFQANSLQKITFVIIFVVILYVTITELFGTALTNHPNTSIAKQKAKTNTTVVLMIASYTGDFTRRSILRETYLSFSDKRFEWVFIISKRNVTSKLAQEMEEFKDITLLDCADDYASLTDKIMQGFAASVELYNFKYLLKADTDTYVNVPKFIDYMISLGKKRDTIYAGNLGFIKVSHNPIYMHPPCKRYTHYMLGGGYAMSYDLVLYFAENWHLLYNWKAEDLSIGVHLQLLNKKVVVDVFTFYTGDVMTECAKGSYLVNHKVSEEQMYYLHHSTLRTGSMCSYAHNSTLKKEISRLVPEFSKHFKKIKN